MLKSRKHVFWEAIFVSIVLLLIGLFVGMMIEKFNQEEISSFYMQSEISLVDELAMVQFSDELSVDCNMLRDSTTQFASDVYDEAKLLEKYDESGKITEGLKTLHRKYDLMRTLLWLNTIQMSKCDNFDLVVYLYQYETDDWEKKAEQIVWSKVLLELDSVSDREMVLLPIAADQNITTLNFLMAKYNVTELPAVIINNEKVLYDVETAEDLENYLS